MSARAADRNSFITFYCLLPDAPAPTRADRSLLGSMPVRAYQHCEPMRAASAFGWYVFPPIDFMLMWDGSEIVWKTDGSVWESATSVVMPQFERRYRREVPKHNRVQDPFPFLMARRETGLIQIWPGVLVRTQPGWSTLVRAPANLTRSNAYEVLEGIIETDWWFGPLISTVRLRQTNRPISFRTDRPLFQLQPVRADLYESEELDDVSIVRGLSALRADDWSRFENTMDPINVRPGIYASHVRQRRRQAGFVAKPTHSREPN